MKYMLERDGLFLRKKSPTPVNLEEEISTSFNGHLMATCELR